MNITPDEQAEVEAALGLAVPPVTPSPELKSSIMAKLSTTPQLPARDDAVAPERDDAPADIFRAAPAATPAETKAQARWFTRPVGVLVAAAAALLLFAGGTLLGAGLGSGTGENLQAAELASLTAASDLQRASATLNDGATATLIWSLDQQRSAILVDELPALPDGKTYQLWYIGGDGPRPAGIFQASASATSWHVLDGSMQGGDTVGVTVEPSGGSTAPTTDPIVAIAST